MGSTVVVTDVVDLTMKNIVVDTIVQYSQEHLPSVWRDDQIFNELFQTLRLFDMLLLRDLDDERYLAFYWASCEAIEVYAKKDFGTTDWQGYIVEVWQEMNELIRDNPRPKGDLN